MNRRKFLQRTAVGTAQALTPFSARAATSRAKGLVPAPVQYPNITVPAGQWSGLPVGISFFGRAWSEPGLLKLPFAFEPGTNARRPPTFRPTID